MPEIVLVPKQLGFTWSVAGRPPREQRVQEPRVSPPLPGRRVLPLLAFQFGFLSGAWLHPSLGRMPSCLELWRCPLAGHRSPPIPTPALPTTAKPHRGGGQASQGLVRALLLATCAASVCGLAAPGLSLLICDQKQRLPPF